MENANANANINRDINKDRIKDNNTIHTHFEALWVKYPNRQGKKDALRHYKASVLTDQNRTDIEQALNNYLQCKQVKEGFIKNGSTWFNQWQDWVVNPISGPPKVKFTECPKHPGIMIGPGTECYRCKGGF